MTDIYEDINNGMYTITSPYGKTPEERKTYNEEARNLMAKFKNDLEVYNGVSNNPKKDKLFQIAWDMGHSYSYSEVANYYADMVDLIK